jgi:hypothetical protein
MPGEATSGLESTSERSAMLRRVAIEFMTVDAMASAVLNCVYCPETRSSCLFLKPLFSPPHRHGRRSDINMHIRPCHQSADAAVSSRRPILRRMELSMTAHRSSPTCALPKMPIENRLV